MKPLFFLLALFTTLSAYGKSEEIRLIRYVETLYEAGQYRKGAEFLQKIDPNTLKPWQQARLRYNLANFEIGKKQYEKALQNTFSLQHILDNDPPLSRAVHTNRAYALYFKGSETLKQDTITFDEYTETLLLLRQALSEWKMALEAEEEKQQFFGEENPPPPLDLFQLKTLIKRDFAEVLQRYHSAKIENLSESEGVILLLSHVKQMKENLSFLEKIKNPENYRLLFLDAMSSWDPIWKAQQEDTPGVDTAYQNYTESLKLLTENHLSESQKSLQEAGNALTNAMERLWGADPLNAALGRLLAQYQRTLDQLPLQQFALTQLIREQERIQKAFPKAEDMETIHRFLEKSLEELEEGPSSLARFFLYEARQRTRRLIKKEQKTPTEILQRAIEEQEHAWMLHRLSQEMEAKDPIEVEVLLNDAQKETLKAAAPFLDAVIAQEHREFAEKCQCHPWDRVIPLFAKGKVAAEEGMKYVTEHWGGVKKEEALTLWREALRLMKEDPEEQNQEEEQESTAETNMENIVQLLQQMEGDDQSFKKSEPSPSPKGARPW